MKIIFLDIDGVLDIFDPNEFLQTILDYALERLKKIVEKSGAKIVVVSTWRYGSEKFAKINRDKRKERENWRLLAAAFEKFGLEIYDVSPWQDDLKTRSEEILHYLTANPDITNFVILDDCYSDNYEKYDTLKSRLVFVDANAALQERDVEAALNILNK